MEQIRPDVYVETNFHGVTVSAIGTANGLVCVDTPTLPADARRWRLQLTQLEAGPVQFIVNTDHNRDRTLGNQWFDASIIAHENTYVRLREYPDVYKPNVGEIGGEHEFAHDLAGIRNVLPQLTFTKSLELFRGAHPIRLWHRGGSASGAIWVELPSEKVLFVGDTIFANHPFIGDSDIQLWLENLASIESPIWNDYIVVTGRRVGPTHDAIQYSRLYLSYLQNLLLNTPRTPETELPYELLVNDLLERFPVADELRHLMARRLLVGFKRILNLEGTAN
jgi:glyoxylase-like metal-dependent hydrolase (beta-lactamase superfamily II)